MAFTIRIADKKIKIYNMFSNSEEALACYASDSEEYDFTISIDKEELIKEQKRCVEVKDNWDRYIRNMKSYELELSYIHREIVSKLFKYDILMMHGVLLAVGNSGYIITAPSGVGKTTRALQWLNVIDEAYIVNGDKPLLHIGDTVTGYGTPWCGKEGYNKNTSVTLKGICFLSRSDENIIEKISLNEAFSRLINQVYIPENQTVQVINLLKKMSKSVLFCNLKCNTSEEAALLTYNYLTQCESEH